MRSSKAASATSYFWIVRSSEVLLNTGLKSHQDPSRRSFKIRAGILQSRSWQRCPRAVHDKTTASLLALSRRSWYQNVQAVHRQFLSGLKQHLAEAFGDVFCFDLCCSAHEKSHSTRSKEAAQGKALGSISKVEVVVKEWH